MMRQVAVVVAVVVVDEVDKCSYENAGVVDVGTFAAVAEGAWMQSTMAVVGMMVMLVVVEEKAG
jgi:hypothetical protein